MSEIAKFENATAVFSAKNLLDEYLLDPNPWEVQDMVPIPGDIGPFMENNSLRIPPGKFTDEDDGLPMNVGDGKWEDHLGRIAWLVDNWDDSENEPLMFSSGKNHISFENGLHRAFAMVHLGVEEVQISFDRGHKETIENQPSFIRWDDEPTLSGEFGSNILASNDELFRILKSDDKGTILVQDEDHNNLLKAKLKGEDKFIHYMTHDKERFAESSTFTSKNLHAALKNAVSPLFNELPNDFFSGLDESAQPSKESTLNLSPT